MSSNVSLITRRRSFNEGRLAATKPLDNPYDNPIRRKLFERGWTLQRDGKLSDPIPSREPHQHQSYRPFAGSPHQEHKSKPQLQISRRVLNSKMQFERHRPTRMNRGYSRRDAP